MSVFVPEMNQAVRVHAREMVVVEPGGARSMVPPQTELLLIPSTSAHVAVESPLSEP